MSQQHITSIQSEDVVFRGVQYRMLLLCRCVRTRRDYLLQDAQTWKVSAGSDAIKEKPRRWRHPGPLGNHYRDKVIFHTPLMLLLHGPPRERQIWMDEGPWGGSGGLLWCSFALKLLPGTGVTHTHTHAQRAGSNNLLNVSWSVADHGFLRYRVTSPATADLWSLGLDLQGRDTVIQWLGDRVARRDSLTPQWRSRGEECGRSKAMMQLRASRAQKEEKFHFSSSLKPQSRRKDAQQAEWYFPPSLDVFLYPPNTGNRAVTMRWPLGFPHKARA